MSDMTRDRDAVMGQELDAALEDAAVLADEYAGYDEGAARRRIARRVVNDRMRSRGIRRSVGRVPLPGHALPVPADHLVLDAACHVRAARGLDTLAWHLVDEKAFVQRALADGAWPYGRDAALLFGCVLHLGGRREGAQFWFQYAAGAGSGTAARCLYLHHLARAEVATARHWDRRADLLPPEEELPELPDLPANLEGALGASVIWTSPPITTQDLTGLPPAHGHRGNAARRRLPERLRTAVTALEPEDDPDLGEVVLPSPAVAVALARHARLTRLHLTDEASSWSGRALRAPRVTQAARRAQPGRPAPAALESVHQALRALEIINRHSGGVSLAQIARQTQLPQLTLARVMERLVRSNLAAPVGPAAYAAGSALGLTAAVGDGGQEQIRQTLAWVRDAVGAAVYVARYHDGEITVTHYADSPSAPVVEEWVDFRATAHASAVGKALMTQLDHAGRRDHLARHPLTPFTAHTLTSEQVLFHQLDTRAPGAALLDLQEYALGTVCAAVPITAGPNPECVALSVPAPDPRRLGEAARILQSEAAAVLLALLVAGSTEPAAPQAADRPAEGTGSTLLTTRS